MLSVAVLLAPVGSLTPDGGVIDAEFDSVPVAAALIVAVSM